MTNTIELPAYIRADEDPNGAYIATVEATTGGGMVAYNHGRIWKAEPIRVLLWRSIRLPELKRRCCADAINEGR